MVQLGTVVEGSMESTSTNRLTKRHQKGTFLEEVMENVFSTKDDYVKKKYHKMQRDKLEVHKRQQTQMRKKQFSRRKRR